MSDTSRNCCGMTHLCFCSRGHTAARLARSRRCHCPDDFKAAFALLLCFAMNSPIITAGILLVLPFLEIDSEYKVMTVNSSTISPWEPAVAKSHDRCEAP